MRDIIPLWLVIALPARDLFLWFLVPFLRTRGYSALPVHFLGKAATAALLYAFPLLLLGDGDLHARRRWPRSSAGPSRSGASACTGGRAALRLAGAPGARHRARGSARGARTRWLTDRRPVGARPDPARTRRWACSTGSPRPRSTRTTPMSRRSGAGAGADGQKRATPAAGGRTRWPSSRCWLVGALLAMAGVETARNATTDRRSKDTLVSQVQDRREELNTTGPRSRSCAPTSTRCRRIDLDTTTEGRQSAQPADALGAAAGARRGPRPRRPHRGRRRAPGESEQEIVLDTDLQRLVNGLWAAGAEAIAINGHRLTNLTAIRHGGRRDHGRQVPHPPLRRRRHR